MVVEVISGSGERQLTDSLAGAYGTPARWDEGALSPEAMPPQQY